MTNFPDDPEFDAALKMVANDIVDRYERSQLGHLEFETLTVVEAPGNKFTLELTGIREIDEALLRLWVDRHVTPDLMFCSSVTRKALSDLFIQNRTHNVYLHSIGLLDNQLTGYINKYASISSTYTIRIWPFEPLPAGVLMFARLVYKSPDPMKHDNPV